MMEKLHFDQRKNALMDKTGKVSTGPAEPERWGLRSSELWTRRLKHPSLSQNLAPGMSRQAVGAAASTRSFSSGAVMVLMALDHVRGMGERSHVIRPT